MRALVGAVLGVIAGGFCFFLINYDQLLLVGQHRAGLLVTMQLNQAVDMYLIGGAIVGSIVGLSMQKERV
jgi:hypothetical protein